MKRLSAAVAAALIAVPAGAAAPPFQTSAPVAYMVDLSSGAVLFAKDALVTGDRVLRGRELAGPEHTANFVSASVSKATVPSIHVLSRR